MVKAPLIGMGTAAVFVLGMILAPIIGTLAAILIPVGTIVVLGMGAFIWFWLTHRERVKSNSRNLIGRVMVCSDWLKEYHNNLDELLGIRTSVCTLYPQEGMYLTSETTPTLRIDEEWDWYLTAKHSTELAFKVVGLHKTDRTKNVVYILGRRREYVQNSNSFYPGLPYLIQEKDVEGALSRLDNIGITLPGSEAEASGAVLGMINVMIGASLMPAINKITEDIVRGRRC